MLSVTLLGPDLRGIHGGRALSAKIQLWISMLWSKTNTHKSMSSSSMSQNLQEPGVRQSEYICAKQFLRESKSQRRGIKILRVFFPWKMKCNVFPKFPLSLRFVRFYTGSRSAEFAKGGEFYCTDPKCHKGALKADEALVSKMKRVFECGKCLGKCLKNWFSLRFCVR